MNSLWDFKKKKVPTTTEIEHALSLTDFSRVSWVNGMLSIPMGMSIDFGGVVKEYAADSLAVLAKKLGVNMGLLISVVILLLLDENRVIRHGTLELQIPEILRQKLRQLKSTLGD